MIAHDIARQLVERGEKVALLVLLDPTGLHGYRSTRVGRNVKTLRRRWSSFRRRLRRRLTDEPKEASVARFIERVGLASRHAEMAFVPGSYSEEASPRPVSGSRARARRLKRSRFPGSTWTSSRNRTCKSWRNTFALL